MSPVSTYLNYTLILKEPLSKVGIIGLRGTSGAMEVYFRYQDVVSGTCDAFHDVRNANESPAGEKESKDGPCVCG